jgi:hypothetical protein
MSLEDVKEMLGPPAREATVPAGTENYRVVAATWKGSDGFWARTWINVHFDAAGAVQSTEYEELTLPNRIRGMWYRAFNAAAPF